MGTSVIDAFAAAWRWWRAPKPVAAHDSRRDGRAAFEAGLSLEDNPHPAGTEAHARWASSWEEAQWMWAIR